MHELKSNIAGHIACFAAYAIFGLNIIICKDLTSSHLISPIAIFSLRSVFAALIFWILSAFFPKEKIRKSDYPRIFLASFLGFFVCQLTFLMAISQVTPLTCSIVTSLSPVYTMFIAAIAIKEPVSLKKAGGVFLSLAGIIFLIFNSVRGENGVSENSFMGIFLMILNGLSFALYLGIFKPLISRYAVVNFMKWIFTFATIMSMPISARELIHLDWSAIPLTYYLELAFLIICATCISYFLIPFAQKRLRPTLVSMYSYVQPMIATVISIILGMDVLNWQKVLAAVMVFAGVVFVSKSKKKGA